MTAPSGVTRRRGLIALAVLGMLIAAAVLYMRSGTGDASPGDAAKAAAGGAGAGNRPPPPVTVSKPAIRDIVEWKEFTGQFEAAEFVEIRARVAGYLTSIHFNEGQLVNAGDLLFVIDPRPFEIALESAKAQLSEATTQMELAQVQLERAETLRQRDFTSESTYDQRQAELRSATAAVDAAKAAVRAAELDLEFTHLKAPVSGRAGSHLVSVGNLVAGGTSGTPTLLTTIVSLDPIHFVFDVSEADMLAYKRAVQRGDLPSARDETITVYGQFTDDEEWPLNGAIDFIDNQIDRSSGTIRKRAVFSNADLFVTPGQFGRLRVPASGKHTAMLVPEEAIVTDQANKLLYTVTDDGTVAPKPIVLGPQLDGNLRVVRSGVSPDDRVIINGLLRARPGAKVTPEQGLINADNVAVPE